MIIITHMFGELIIDTQEHLLNPVITTSRLFQQTGEDQDTSKL